MSSPIGLRESTSERAAAVQQDPTVSSIFDNPAARPSAIISSRSADSDHDANTAVLGQLHPKEPPEPEDHMVTGGAESEDSEDESLEDDNLLGSDDPSEEDDSTEDDPLEEDASSVDTDITQVRVSRPIESGDEWLSQQLENDTETNHNQHVGRISYYSSGDFEPQDSGLEEVKVNLQAPSGPSSRYGNMTDVSRSFVLVTSDR